MSFQTRLNGFTIWANYRLQLVGHDSMDNILTDFMKGYNLKLLVESLTGRPLHKMKTFDGVSESQKEMRIQWLSDECKACGIIGDQLKVDCRLITLRSFDHITDFLWNLVCFDIDFVWIRSDYMRQRNIEKLISSPFSCIPPSWSTTGTQRTHEINSKTAATERDTVMISQKKLTKAKTLPENCILEMINRHVKMTRDGKKLNDISSFSDVLDVRVFCALLNSIVADTFISDVLLNDKWTLTLILETINNMLRFSSSFSLDDLMEGDNTSLCCYFTVFFMAGYSLRQSKAAVERLDFLSFSSLKFTEELSKLKATVPCTGKEVGRREELEELLKNYKQEMSLINANYDITSCRGWVSDVSAAQNQAWVTISTAMKRKYEVITMPMNISVKDLSDELFVNLEISASGFYQLTCKETVTNERKIIIQHKDSGKFYDYHKICDGKKQRTARGVLGISSANTQDLSPKQFPEFHIFLETLSSNKTLRAGWLFIYQIFPDDTSKSLNLLFRSIKNGELDTVKNLTSFFQSEALFVNGVQGHGKTTALHLACRVGKFDMVLYLLEQNADIHLQNSFGNTPLHVAIENGQHQNGRDICKLLIEWGAGIDIRNKNKLTPLEDSKNVELCTLLQHLYDYWEDVTPKLENGDLDLLRSITQMSEGSVERLSTLRSRCVEGSTLLHIASYYSYSDIVIQLLVLGVDINIRDHNFSTPLHKANSADIIRLLIKHGGDISLTDIDGNTPLHCILVAHSVDRNIDCEAIRVLVSKGIDMLQRNSRGYTAIHCASIRGTTNALQTLIDLDSKGIVKHTLNNDTATSVPSAVYLAIENDHLSCARWLLDHGFQMRINEGGEVVEKILTGMIKCTDGSSTFQLLFENGASLNTVYSGGNTCLHLASTSIDMLSTLQQFIEFKFDVNQKNNNNWSPLHYAASSNNCQAAAILLKHGADITSTNTRGLMPFDYIDEYDHWISCGLFDDVTVETLRAFSLKKTRDLIRSITDKLKKAELTGVRSRSKR